MFFDNAILSILNQWQNADEQLKNTEQRKSITAPKLDDGAHEIEKQEYNGMMSQLGNSIDPQAKNTRELIDVYRGLMQNYEVDNAVQEIINTAVVYEKGHEVVSLDLDNTEFSENIKNLISEEFQTALNLLNFQRKGADHFKRWYVDSRIFFHKIIDENDISKGIVELRRLDPRNVNFVREITTEMENGVKIVTDYEDYFTYDTAHETYMCNGMSFAPGTRIKLPYSSVVYAHSGLTDCCGKNIIGYLHRAVKSANQLKMLEDAMVIYRITRAPDRRVFYIDTGNMPSKLATQHMQNIMNSMKNRIVYDAATGKVKNQQNTMALTEDLWLQRRDGKAVTEVETLPGMSGMNEFDDVLYFRKALYMALRVPLSRIPDEQQQAVFDAGSTITRDEITFDAFITHLQHNFEEIILNPLRTNLIIKKIITKDEWDENINNIKIVFHENSYFVEIKDIEIKERRINAFNLAEPIIGKCISYKTAMKEYLQMSDEDIEREQKLIKEEQSNKILYPPIDTEDF